MTIVNIPRNLRGKSFVVYSIDLDADYDGITDMIRTNAASVVITVCDNPEQWFEDNCGMNEVPLAFVQADGKMKRTLFGRNSYIFRAV